MLSPLLQEHMYFADMTVGKMMQIVNVIILLRILTVYASSAEQPLMLM
jgi:hypothetical protein